MTNLFLTCLVYSSKSHMALALILKQPQFWAQKVGILGWLIIGKQFSYLCKFPENVN